MEKIGLFSQPEAALALALNHEPVPEDHVVEGSPTTGYSTLGDYAGKELGVWEMTPGAMSDTETDELFIVLTGDATVQFLDEARSVQLAAGFVGQLHAGARTIWTVRETLRKVCLS